VRGLQLRRHCHEQHGDVDGQCNTSGHYDAASESECDGGPDGDLQRGGERDGALSYQWQRWNGTAWANVGSNSTSYTTPATVLGDNGAPVPVRGV